MQAQPSVTPTAQPQAPQQKTVLEARARNGANWFFWIGGLSIINTIIYMFGGSISFIIGLGATQFVDGVATAFITEYGSEISTVIKLVAFAIDIGIAGIFVVAGLLSRNKYRWALITGMVLYVIDALIFILVSDWMGLIFHALALFGLYGGLRAMNLLRKLDSAEAGAIPTMAISQPETGKSSILRILGGSCAVYMGILVVLAVVGFILTR